MSRATLEVADIIHTAGDSFWQQHGSHYAWPHRKVPDAIARCRTAALGGHRDQCAGCGYQAISYNSCRNRHCPRYQGNARARWLRARSTELLPVPCFHVVFTLPPELSALALGNKRVIYDLLYSASAAAMLEMARDPKHLGAEIGFLGVLHTWGQNLQQQIAAPEHFRRFLRRLFTSDWVVCQATLRRPGTRPPLPGSIHPSRGHLQPSSRRPQRGSGLLPLARLRTRQQAEGHDRIDA